MTVDIHPVQFGGHSGYCHMRREPPYRTTGVVICSPPGRDGRCGYRFLFELAQNLAAQGIIVLRYEPLGCGNSADLLDPDGDAVSAWTTGLSEAVATLRQIAPVEKVVVAGLRFSATLAVMCSQVSDGLMLFGPILKGRSWLRELKIARAVLAPTTEDRPV
jgi:pimeloyl-ACP methyl ester carboxylesterase